MTEEKPYQIFPLFSMPLYSTIVDFITEEEKEFIFNLEYGKIDTPAAGPGYTSFDQNILNHPSLSNLKQNILHEFHKFTTIVSIDTVDYYIHKSWAVKHQQYNNAQKHIHVNSLFSGILYIHTNNDSGIVKFHRQLALPSLTPFCLDIPRKQWNIFNCEEWSILPENNQLLLFPSTVEHSVTENLSTEERYCIAFDVFARGSFGNLQIN